MSAQEKTEIKTNAIISQLFQIVIELNQEQQKEVLDHAEIIPVVDTVTATVLDVGKARHTVLQHHPVQHVLEHLLLHNTHHPHHVLAFDVG